MVPGLALFCALLLTVSGAALAAGEAAEQQEQEQDQDQEESVVFSPEVEAILNQTPDAESYGSLEKCIPARSIRRTEVLDDQHIVFELPSKKYYLVQFERACHMMRPDSTIIYEPRGSQLCRMDFVRVYDSFSPASIGPPCSIPGFYPVTAEQIVLLKETLKAKRKAEIDAYKAEKKAAKAARKAEKQAEKAATDGSDDAER